jgi:hypothetical protein
LFDGSSAQSGKAMPRTSRRSATRSTRPHASRLARAGEVLISAETAVAGGLETAGLERRTLELRGREQTIDAWVCKGSEVSLGAAAA